MCGLRCYIGQLLGPEQCHSVAKSGALGGAGSAPVSQRCCGRALATSSCAALQELRCTSDWATVSAHEARIRTSRRQQKPRRARAEQLQHGLRLRAATQNQAAAPLEQASEPSSAQESTNGATAADQPSSSAAPCPIDVHGVQVHVRNVTKTYNSKGKTYRALDNINLDVEAGTLVALLGPSGSGKTTLLRMIAGLEEVSEGVILFDEKDVVSVPVQSRGVGFMFQSFALFKHMTVGENIAFGPRIQKHAIDIETRVLDMLELVEMKGYGPRFPAQLSGGQRQRVALARALAVNPNILLLDEPFGALDPEVKQEVRRGVKEVISRVGVTSILVTHDREEAFDIADKIVVFNRGQIHQIGSADDIQKTPATPFVASFVEDINKMPAACQFVKRMGVRTHKSKVLCRPSLIRVETEPPPYLCGRPEASPPFSPATVLDRKDVGSVIKYWVRFDDGVEAQVHVEGRRVERYVDLDLQQRVYLRLDRQSFMPFFDHEVESYPIAINEEEVSMQSAQL